MKYRMRIFYRMSRFAFWIYFKMFHRLKVYGQGHTSKGGGILASNHASYYDPPLIAAACPEEIHFLARKTLFRSLFGVLISCLNAHPISSDVSSLSVIKHTCELLKQGKKVVIFPEGARTETGNLSEIKSGVALLAFRSDCHVIPTYIHGSFTVWNKFAKFPKLWGKLAVIFGSPIELDMFEALPKKERQDALTAELIHRLGGLREWYAGGASGSPP